VAQVIHHDQDQGWRSSGANALVPSLSGLFSDLWGEKLST